MLDLYRQKKSLNCNNIQIEVLWSFLFAKSYATVTETNENERQRMRMTRQRRK